MAVLPEALSKTPRALPAWMLSPFWYHFMAGLIAASAVALGVATLEASTELGVGEGPPDGTGKVVSARIARGYRSRHGEVTFTHGGVTEKCEVHMGEVPTLKAGQELPYWIIKGHVAGDEIVLEPCARLSNKAAPVRTTIVAVLSVVTLLAAVFVYLHERRRYRLFTDGAAASGTIQSVARAGKGGTGWRIEFKVDGPPSFTGMQALFRRRCLQMGVEDPRPGDTVHVVYDPDNTKRHQIWGLAR